VSNGLTPKDYQVIYAITIPLAIFIYWVLFKSGKELVLEKEQALGFKQDRDKSGVYLEKYYKDYIHFKIYDSSSYQGGGTRFASYVSFMHSIFGTFRFHEDIDPEFVKEFFKEVDIDLYEAQYIVSFKSKKISFRSEEFYALLKRIDEKLNNIVESYA